MNLFLRREFLALPPGLGSLCRPSPEPDPFDDPEWLACWKQAPRQPIWQSKDLVTARLLRAIRDQTATEVRYRAGSTPGVLRRITPNLVFIIEGFHGS